MKTTETENRDCRHHRLPLRVMSSNYKTCFPFGDAPLCRMLSEGLRLKSPYLLFFWLVSSREEDLRTSGTAGHIRPIGAETEGHRVHRKTFCEDGESNRLLFWLGTAPAKDTSLLFCEASRKNAKSKIQMLDSSRPGLSCTWYESYIERCRVENCSYEWGNKLTGLHNP